MPTCACYRTGCRLERVRKTIRWWLIEWLTQIEWFDPNCTCQRRLNYNLISWDSAIRREWKEFRGTRKGFEDEGTSEEKVQLLLLSYGNANEVGDRAADNGGLQAGWASPCKQLPAMEPFTPHFYWLTSHLHDDYKELGSIKDRHKHQWNCQAWPLLSFPSTTRKQWTRGISPVLLLLGESRVPLSVVTVLPGLQLTPNLTLVVWTCTEG